MARFTFFVPHWRPVSYNQARCRHWSVEHRLKRETADVLRLYSLLASVPLATGKRRVSITVLLGPRQRHGDRDNGDKILLDSLVTCGLLTDDSDAGLEGRVEVEWAKCEGGEWGTRVTLTDVAS